jgi:RecA/RadA recombinase
MTQEKKTAGKVTAFDIDKLVKKAQEAYTKKEAGLAKQLCTGATLPTTDDDSDYVMWTGGDHWHALTHLKGLKYGIITQISGKADSGKSTHAMSFMKYAQEQGTLVILWDSERKFQAGRFDRKIGGDSSKLVLVRSNNINDGSKAVAYFVNAAKEINPDIKILIVWDSVGATLNSTEDKEDTENYSQQPGVSAKETSGAIHKFQKLMNKYMNKETGEESIALLVINQTYASIGMGVSTQIEKGGGTLYYLSSIIIQLSRKQDLTRTKDGEKYKYGIVSRAKIKKNHLFDGDESIYQMDLVISADGVRLAKDVKKFDDIKGWDDAPDQEDEADE